MMFRMFLVLAIATAAPATLVFADDRLNPPSPTIQASGPTAAEFLPMTRSERLRSYVRSISDGESVLLAAASAGIRQAENSPKEWHGRAEGFGYRVGDAYAQHVIRRTLQYGASSVLHEDNRYFASGDTGFLRRAKYAVASTFLARRDNGQRQISFSRLGGAAGASFISRAWQPLSTTSAGDGATSFGIAMGTDVGFNLFREFWPDLRRHFRKE
jgi:hypothetical protein